MPLRVYQLRWHLIATFLLAVFGIWLFSSGSDVLEFLKRPFQIVFRLERGQGAVHVFLFYTLILAYLFLRLDSHMRLVDKEQRDLERNYNKLELVVSDARPETQVLETLSDISVRFLERTRLAPLLEHISLAAQRVLRADVCVLEVVADGGKPTRFIQGTQAISFGKEMHARVIEQGRSILINNIRNHPQYIALAEQNLLGMLVAPFEIRGKVIGLIGVFSQQEGNFTGRDLKLLEVFARHGALLIEATRLIEAVQGLSLRSKTEDVADLQHLRDALSIQKEMSDYEFDVARRIQADLLPETLPQVPGTRFEAISIPAKEVGGDFYDVMDLGNGTWGIVIGDVSGKGVPAALVTAMSQAVLHMVAPEESSPSKVLCRLNEMLYRETPPTMFLSMFYALWVPARRALIYSSAGHEHPLLFERTQNACRKIECKGIALGALESIEAFLEDRELVLSPGDSLLLYTDGAIEARNKQNAMFGIERLQKDIAQILHRSKNGYVQNLFEDIQLFTSGAEQHDDITMLALSLTETA